MQEENQAILVLHGRSHQIEYQGSKLSTEFLIVGL